MTSLSLPDLYEVKFTGSIINFNQTDGSAVLLTEEETIDKKQEIRWL